MIMKITLLLVAFGAMSVDCAQNEIKIDTSKSYVKWTGSNLFQFNEHFGTVKFESGKINLAKDSISGGQFVIDMNSIVNTDGKYNEMLVDHLKGSDFFEVEKFPTAKLEIIKIKYTDSINLDIEAKLTIKDVTEILDYRSTFENFGNERTMKSKFKIDRTRWKINYESKGMVGSVKDGIISDAIEFEVVITSEREK